MSLEASYGLIEMGFVYSVAIGIGIWQVVKMRRMIARDREARERQAREAAVVGRSSSEGERKK
jgi:6,7-dimethyl-8-ribityllumazine synthase